jgi:hypothetical protein
MNLFLCSPRNFYLRFLFSVCIVRETRQVWNRKTRKSCMMTSLRKISVMFYLYNMRFTVSFLLPFFLINVNLFCRIIMFFRNKRVNILFSYLFFLMRRNVFYRHEVLPYAIKVLQAAGYDLVTVAECLGEDPYLRVEDPSVRDVCQVLSFFSGIFYKLVFFLWQDTWHC